MRALIESDDASRNNYNRPAPRTQQQLSDSRARTRIHAARQGQERRRKMEQNGAGRVNERMSTAPGCKLGG